MSDIPSILAMFVQSDVCPNCHGHKTMVQLVCTSCEESEFKGTIEIEYTDGRNETFTV